MDMISGLIICVIVGGVCGFIKYIIDIKRDPMLQRPIPLIPILWGVLVGLVIWVILLVLGILK